MRIIILLISFVCFSASAGIVNPDCTVEKAAKSTAMKATVGVGGRCTAKKTAADSVNLDNKKDNVSDAKSTITSSSKEIVSATKNVVN